MWTTIAFLIGGAVLVAAGLLIGGFFGVTTMCLFQINWHEAQEEYRITDKESGKQEGGFDEQKQ
jgi:hypothetical protein